MFSPRPEAHPRSRGENRPVACSLITRLGSSPLTRGKPALQRRREALPGLIPAHAGKTSSPGSATSQHRAHPRSRGENLLCEPAAPDEVGSSPLMRGKRLCRCGSLDEGGLIPAHAGKTARSQPPRPRSRAHPRSRGENARDLIVPPRAEGSSPLTRGKHRCGPFRQPTRGLIPAHAGKTSESEKSTCPLRAHPRSRGENSDFGRCHCRGSGSSPLTRGKRQ